MLKCRNCSHEIPNYFLSLGNSPLSNSYLSKEALSKYEVFYPLDVYFCDKCYLVQIGEFEKADKIFSEEYAYYSSYSKSWLEHCKKYTENVIERFSLNKSSFVLEIASNDGYLLQYFKEKNIRVLGVEPTGTAKTAIEKGIETDITFFNTEYAKNLSKKDNLPNLIICNNVLAHNPNINDFVQGLKISLKEDGIITIEFPHLLSLLNENQFDTIYHEHFSYFSLYSSINLFKKYDLEIFDVEELSTHGGSLRLYIKHKEDNSKEISINVSNILKKEDSFGIREISTYNQFNEKVQKVKRDFLKILIKLKEENKKIIGYGAPAKGNTLLNYCGIREDFIDFTVDMSPAKQNKYLPGTHIAINHPDIIKDYKPDYIVILPWNIKDEIIQQLEYTKEWNCKLIIPIPNLEII